MKQIFEFPRGQLSIPWAGIAGACVKLSVDAAFFPPRPPPSLGRSLAAPTLFLCLHVDILREQPAVFVRSEQEQREEEEKGGGRGESAP